MDFATFKYSRKVINVKNNKEGNHWFQKHVNPQEHLLCFQRDIFVIGKRFIKF